jgi:hypothetical protein
MSPRKTGYYFVIKINFPNLLKQSLIVKNKIISGVFMNSRKNQFSLYKREVGGTFRFIGMVVKNRVNNKMEFTLKVGSI